MNTSVKVRKRKDHGLVEIDEGNGWNVYTRVWMGIIDKKPRRRAKGTVGAQAGARQHFALLGRIKFDESRTHTHYDRGVGTSVAHSFDARSKTRVLLRRRDEA